MSFNVKKFEVLRIENNEDIQQINYTTIDCITLPVKSVLKDLGVIFNTKGDFSDQLDIKTAKARSIAGIILRTFIKRHPEHMMMLFKALFIPIIAYGSII